MISGHDFYMVVSAMMPLYVAMILAYGSVRWWKIFTPDQCAGINRFVAVFAIPFLCFNFISKNDPYAMSLRFIAADTLQKIIMLVALILWASFTKRGSLDWLITIFSLSTLPNTLVIGIPLLVAMYGEYCKSLMVQIVVLQCIVWYTLLLFLFEFRAAKRLIAEQFPDTAGSIRSVKVDSDVISLDGNECLETDAIIEDDGKLHVTVRKSNASRSRKSLDIPRPSSFSGAEISNSTDFHAMNRAQSYPKRHSSFGAGDVFPDFKAFSPRTSNFSEARLGHTSTKPQQTDLSTNEVRLSVSGTVPTRDGRVNPETRAEPNAGSTGSATGHSGTDKQMPPGSVMTRLIMVMVWRKLIRNPNTYSSLIGLIWSLIHFRWHIEMPIIIDKSITILSDAGLGMAMFTLGLFMALQPSLIPCGKDWAAYSMAVRFITGPAVMAVAALVVGIRGELLKVAIVQAALPQALVTFVFAKEYNVHPQILSTSVIFGMVIAIPVTLIYYIVLGL